MSCSLLATTVTEQYDLNQLAPRVRWNRPIRLCKPQNPPVSENKHLVYIYSFMVVTTPGEMPWTVTNSFKRYVGPIPVIARLRLIRDSTEA